MMWELENFWTDENLSSRIAPQQTMTNEIRVLLVDHEREFLSSTTKLLETSSYKVTTVELASEAISMLSEQNQDFDLVVANMHSPDMHGFNLLQEAVKMNLHIILISNDQYDATLERKVLGSGAYLFIPRSATSIILKYIWQVIMREVEKNGKGKEDEGTRSVDHGGSRDYNSFKRKRPLEAEGSEDYMRGMQIPKRKARGQKLYNDEGENEDNNLTNGGIKKKVYAEWTGDLHSRFMDAVHQLGEGRCYPKDILELMNVPGLTRMQVASHLQKCRNDNWRSSKRRKSLPPNSQASSGGNTNPPRRKFDRRRFGSMPRLPKDSFSNAIVINENQTNPPNPQIHSSASSNDIIEHDQRGELIPNIGQDYYPHMHGGQYRHLAMGAPLFAPSFSMPNEDQLGPFGPISQILSTGNNPTYMGAMGINADNNQFHHMPVEDGFENPQAALAMSTPIPSQQPFVDVKAVSPGIMSVAGSSSATHRRQPSEPEEDFEYPIMLDSSFPDFPEFPPGSAGAYNLNFDHP